MNYKLKIWFLLVFTIGAIVWVTGCTITNPERKPREFTLENNTGDTITAVYLKHPSSAIWGSSVSSLSIQTGSSRTIHVPDEERYDNLFRMDIKVDSHYGVFYTKISRVVTNKSKVTFVLSDLDDFSPRRLTIANLTGETISAGFVKKPDSPFWGNSLLLLQITHATERTITVPSDNMSSEHRADIMLESSDSTTYIRNNQRIIHRGTVQFQSGDLDDESARTFILGNLTGDTINSVHMKNPETLFWGSNMSTLPLATGNTRVLRVSRERMNDAFASDIKIETQQGVVFLKSDAPIVHMSQINFTIADLEANSPRSVTIGNATGDTITHILVKRPDSVIWGDNFIALPFPSGQTRTITISGDRMDAQFRSDIRLETQQRVVYFKSEEQIVHNSEINFTMVDLEANSPRVLTIGNSTGHWVTHILVKSPDSEQWGDNFLSLPFPDNATRSITIPRDRMNAQYRSDIRLISTNLTNFTKENNQILHNGEILFLPGDADH
jgi:hypothetical protein